MAKREIQAWIDGRYITDPDDPAFKKALKELEEMKKKKNEEDKRD